MDGAGASNGSTSGSCRQGISARTPKVLQFTTPGVTAPAAAGPHAGTNPIVNELKRYIDAALEIQLSAMERRLLTALGQSGSPQSFGRRSPSGGGSAQPMLHSSVPMGKLEDEDAFEGAARAGYAGMGIDVSSAAANAGDGDEGSTARREREKQRQDEIIEKQKQKEVKQREKFMAKYSGKEIFGENRNSTMGGGGGPPSPRDRRTRLQRIREEGVIINPHGAFRSYWDLTSCVLVCWITIFLPYRLAFNIGEAEYAFNVLDLFIDVFFIIDVFLNMITAYEDDGHLVSRHKSILRHYLNGWFVPDVLASFPVDWLVLFPPPLSPQTIAVTAAGADADAASDSASLSQLIRIVRVVKLLRLLRIARLFRYFGRYEDSIPLISSMPNGLVRLMKLSVVMFVFCHWNGCFQFLIAQLDTIGINATLSEVDEALLAEEYPNGFHRDSWVERTGIANAPSGTQWEWCFFIAIMQMLAISIGIVEPRRTPEMWGYLVSILLGAVFYAIFVAVLTAVVADLDTSARAYRSRLDMVNQYMVHSQLPRELRAKLRTYYHLVFPSKRSFDEDSILTEVSRPLRQEVCMHKCRSVLAALQLLDDGKSEKGLPGAISQRLERVVFVTDDYIIREGEETEGLFFVSSGLVELFTSAGGEKILTTLGAGSMFGEMALLSQTGRAVASVRVKTFCEGYHLSKASFNTVIHTYPSFKDYLESIARLRLQRNAKKKGIANDDVQALLNDAQSTGQKMSKRKESMLVMGKHLDRKVDRKVDKLMRKLNTPPEPPRASQSCNGNRDVEPAKPRLQARTNAGRASAAQPSSIEEGDEGAFDA